MEKDLCSESIKRLASFKLYNIQQTYNIAKYEQVIVYTACSVSNIKDLYEIANIYTLIKRNHSSIPFQSIASTIL